jgi:hypothetical protein
MMTALAEQQFHLAHQPAHSKPSNYVMATNVT